MFNTPIQIHSPLISQPQSSVSEGNMHLLLAARGSRWQGKCTSISSRLLANSSKPIHTTCCRETSSVLKDREVGYLRQVFQHPSPPRVSCQNPNQLTLSKMASSVSSQNPNQPTLQRWCPVSPKPLMPPWMTLVTHFHLFSFSPLTLLSLLSHLVAFGTSVSLPLLLY